MSLSSKPKIILTQNGFTIDDSRETKFHDIQSVWYILLHWQDENDFNRGMQILTQNGEVLTFSGDFSELISTFDKNLERWSGKDDDDSPHGIYRWRQPGKEYHFVSEMDKHAYNNEKFAYKKVSKKWVWYGVAIFLLLILVMIVATIFLA